MPFLRRKTTDKEQHTAIAWMSGQITTSQMMEEFGKRHVTNALNQAASALRDAYAKGLIKQNGKGK